MVIDSSPFIRIRISEFRVNVFLDKDIQLPFWNDCAISLTDCYLMYYWFFVEWFGTVEIHSRARGPYEEALCDTSPKRKVTMFVITMLRYMSSDNYFCITVGQRLPT